MSSFTISSVVLRESLSLWCAQGLVDHLNRYAASVILAVVYGIRCPRSDSKLLSDFHAYILRWNGFLKPGSHPPIDLIPALKYIPEFLPWGAWKGETREIKRLQREFYFGMVEGCKRRMKESGANGCFMENILDMQDEYELTDDMVA